MKEAALVIIKPDGLLKGIEGHILIKFASAKLDLVGVKLVAVQRKLAEEHYDHIRNKPFFKEVVEYLMGSYHKSRGVLVLVYQGENAIKKCRTIAGLTNPEEADPQSIRGSYGRITTDGLFENVVHVSSSKKEAEREIKLWFGPNELNSKLLKRK